MATPLDSREVDPTASFEIRYRESQVQVECNSAEVGARLASAFTAYGARTEAVGRTPMPSVRITSGAIGPAAGQLLKVPHGGGRIAVPAGTAFIHEGPPTCLVTVDQPTITVTQLGDGAPHLPFLHYMAKYPLRRQVEQQGSVLAHSSAVEIADGVGVLFLGPSGAGKTTAFLELVTRGLRALGNDATLLTPVGSGVEAAAWPHVVRIGEATAGHNRVLNALPGDWARRNPVDGKTEVFFDELDEVFGRPIAAPPCRIGAVVDLSLDLTGTGLDVQPLAGDETGRLLDERLVADRLPTGWLPGWTWKPDTDAVRAVADHLAGSRTPMYRVRAGVATARWADQLADWVRGLDPTPLHVRDLPSVPFVPAA